MTAAVQRTNVRIAALALADLARDHQIIVAHGNGPLAGLLAIQYAGYDPTMPWSPDTYGAETEGMISYLIEQELMNALPEKSRCATLLSRVEVDALDPAFENPSKGIGPVYPTAEAAQIARDNGWVMVPKATGGVRRVVPAPSPLRVIGLDAIKALLDAGHTAVRAGGGGIPVIRSAVGSFESVEAVIEKDATSALLALGLDADALLLLTDVAAVYDDFGGPDQRTIGRTTPGSLEKLELPLVSMGSKVTAATTFVKPSGKLSGIGQLTDIRAILEGRSGTRVTPDQPSDRRLATEDARARWPAVSDA